MGDLVLHDGTMLSGVHEADECALEFCCVHNPSDHPLRDAPLYWMGPVRAMFRVCEHDFRHPDPDDIEFLLARFRFIDVEAICSVHLVTENCDGCCQKQEPVDARSGEAS